ncbi:MAG: MFS transporter [Bacteroidota bacterium]
MKIKKIAAIITLMLVGELIFLLPFIVTRVFRPTFLRVFEITNLQLGTAFSTYGIVAMISYFLGGPIADRFTPRQLLPVSLLATAAGGLFLATIPTVWTLALLYGLWGVTTILLFWSSYVKAQRKLGQEYGQGKAFGATDAGRGLIAASLASAAIFILNALLPTSPELATAADYEKALVWVIITFSGITAFGAVLVWVFLDAGEAKGEATPKITLKDIGQLAQNRLIWMQALILLCAYVGYKCTDDFSLYAQDTFGFDDVDAAKMGTVSFWMRTIAALSAGFLGDRLGHTRMVIACFGLMLLGSLVIFTGYLKAGMLGLIILTIVSTSLGIYGLRGLYYALFKKSRVPLALTGSAAGLVSVVGYTPDVFMGPLMGWILDQNPGETGHQYLFLVLAGFSVVGLGVSVMYRRWVGST